MTILEINQNHRELGIKLEKVYYYLLLLRSIPTHPISVSKSIKRVIYLHICVLLLLVYIMCNFTQNISGQIILKYK